MGRPPWIVSVCDEVPDRAWARETKTCLWQWGPPEDKIGALCGSCDEKDGYESFAHGEQNTKLMARTKVLRVGPGLTRL